MDGTVGIAGDVHLVARNLKQCPQVKQDIEVDALLGNAVCGGAASVDAAVRRIKLNRVLFSSYFRSNLRKPKPAEI